MTDTTLIPLSHMTLQLPDPQILRRKLTDALESEFARARAAQGEILVPEDTFDLQRKLAAAHEILTGYARAFADAGKRVASMQEEQLVDAVGEQAGVPNQGLTVPDAAGDVRLSLDFATARDFDLDQLIAVVVLDEVRRWVSDPEGEPEELAEAAIRRFLGLGKFEPQVTKVKAYAKAVARAGADDLASVVSGAVRDRPPTYKGVKFERK
jgi:hypothetical protein